MLLFLFFQLVNGIPVRMEIDSDEKEFGGSWECEWDQMGGGMSDIDIFTDNLVNDPWAQEILEKDVKKRNNNN